MWMAWGVVAEVGPLRVIVLLRPQGRLPLFCFVTAAGVWG